MTADADDIVELVIRLPRSQLAAWRAEQRPFLLRLQRRHDNVCMTGPLDEALREQERVDLANRLMDALAAGRAVTRAALKAHKQN